MQSVGTVRLTTKVDDGHALLICSLVTNFLFHQLSAIRRITLCNISCRRPYFLFCTSRSRSHTIRCRPTQSQSQESCVRFDDVSFTLTAEHLQRSSDVGVSLSQIHPRMFLSRRGESLEGILGVHVDDDLMTGSDRFEQHMIPALKKRFVCGTLPTGTFAHCGRECTRGKDPTVIIAQDKVVRSLPKIKLTK